MNRISNDYGSFRKFYAITRVCFYNDHYHRNDIILHNHIIAYAPRRRRDVPVNDDNKICVIGRDEGARARARV